MTVKDLMDQLSTVDPTAEIWVYVDCHGCEKLADRVVDDKQGNVTVAAGG
jgi:hypothetical protein